MVPWARHKILMAHPTHRLAQVEMSSTRPDRPLLGVGIETLGHEIIGGVYSNLIFDESFEHPPPPRPTGQPVVSAGWYRLPAHGGNAVWETAADALAGNHSQRLGRGAVIFNAGVNQQAPQGFAFRQGAAYALSEPMPPTAWARVG